MQRYEVLPGVKASSLLTMPVVGGDPYVALETALRKHVVGFLGGDPDRDVDALTTSQDPTGCLYVGSWQGHPRLNVGVAITARNVADVLLVATKGTTPADDSLFGKTGSGIGNSLLVARVLHAAVFALRSTGIIAVRNDPYDGRVRRLYEDMGFQAGEYLRLDDHAALTLTFTYVAQTYQHPAAGGRLSLATPPLPL
jgi:hypothetical protein